MNAKVLRCRVCNGAKPEAEFREIRDGRYVSLAYCRDCKRRDDVTHNRAQRRRAAWGQEAGRWGPERRIIRS